VIAGILFANKFRKDSERQHERWFGAMSRKGIVKPFDRPLLTNDGSATISSEYWLVVFFDYVSGQQFKVYARVGSLINAVEDHFGWKQLAARYDNTKLPEYHVWYIDIKNGKATPVEDPLWRPKEYVRAIAIEAANTEVVQAARAAEKKEER
jgi:hypothetical protein